MDKVGILIITLNRSEFLIRQLEYYKSSNSIHPIYIGDSSNKYHKKQVLKKIEEIKDNLEIHYFHLPDYNDREAHSYIAKKCKESFCAYSGDDDFLVPNSLSKCAEFLSRNTNYRTAQGHSVVFKFTDGNVYGKKYVLGPYWKRTQFIDNSSAERINNFGNNYWTVVFSVRRTIEFNEDLKLFEKIPDRSFGELIQNFTALANGRTKSIDCLYLIRQVHDSTYKLPSKFAWIKNPNWYPSYKIFLNSISKIVSKIDKISNIKAKEEVANAFDNYLKLAFVSVKDSNRLKFKKSLIKMFPFLKKFIVLVHYLKSVIDIKSKNLTYFSLLKKNSPYNKDFILVHNIITKRD